MKVKDSKYSLSYRIVNTDWGSVINQCRWNKGNITGSLLSATGSGELSITDSLALVASVTDLVTPRPGRLRFLAYSAVNWQCLLKSAVESILSNLWCSLWAPLSLSIWSITEYWIQNYLPSHSISVGRLPGSTANSARADWAKFVVETARKRDLLGSSSLR